MPEGETGPVPQRHHCVRQLVAFSEGEDILRAIIPAVHRIQAPRLREVLPVHLLPPPRHRLRSFDAHALPQAVRLAPAGRHRHAEKCRSAGRVKAENFPQMMEIL